MHSYKRIDSFIHQDIHQNGNDWQKNGTPCIVLEYDSQGLVGAKELAPIAYRLPVGDKAKTLNIYCLLIGDMC
jgi:hypothetical protein